MNPNETPKTIEEALKVYADAGIVVDPEHLTEAYVVAAKRRQQLEMQTEADTSQMPRYKRVVEEFNRWYPKFLETLLGIGDVLITLTQTLLIAFGVPGLLALFILVEQKRVMHGSTFFEVDTWLAEAGAWALVIGNLIFELVAHWNEHQAGYKEPPKSQFSLMIWYHRFLYWIGRPADNSKWEPKEKSPAHRARSVLWIITLAILSLALAGSMKDAIDRQSSPEGDPVTWTTAIVNIVTKSNLRDFVTWTGGLVFAIAIVFAAQALTAYISAKVVEIVAIMQGKADDKPRQIAEAAGVAAAYYLFARFKEKQRMLRIQRTQATAADMPLANGVSGIISVSEQTEQMALLETLSRDAEETSEQTTGFKTKLDEARYLLQTNKHYSKLSLDQLVELHPHIKRNTWWKARG